MKACQRRMAAAALVVVGLMLAGQVANGSTLTFHPRMVESDTLRSPDLRQGNSQRLLGNLRIDSVFESVEHLECSDDRSEFVWAPPVRTTMSRLNSMQVRGADSSRANGTLFSPQSPRASAVTRPPFSAGGGSASGGGGGGGGSSDNSSGATAPFDFDIVANATETSDNPSTSINANSGHDLRASEMLTRSHGNRDRRDRSDHVVIPFPPAVWMGLVGLAVVTIARKRLALGG